MQREYRGEVEDCAAFKDGPALKKAKQAYRDHEFSYLKRTHGEIQEAKGEQGFKQRKRVRNKAYEWSMCLNQLVLDVCDEGLERYQIDEAKWGEGDGEEDAWDQIVDPFDLPYLCVSMDGGSDGISAYHFLTNHEHLNMYVWLDEAHRVWNLAKNSIRAMGDWSHFLLMNILYSLCYRPWSECIWFNQARQLVTEWMGHMNPGSDPLLLANFNDIVHEMGMEGREHGDGFFHMVWRLIQDDETNYNKGFKPSCSRWFEQTDCQEFFLKRWSL